MKKKLVDRKNDDVQFLPIFEHPCVCTVGSYASLSDHRSGSLPVTYYWRLVQVQLPLDPGRPYSQESSKMELGKFSTSLEVLESYKSACCSSVSCKSVSHWQVGSPQHQFGSFCYVTKFDNKYTPVVRTTNISLISDHFQFIKLYSEFSMFLNLAFLVRT